MAPRERIGLRHIKALLPGQTVWDATVTGFGARRQKGSAVAYILFYRAREGRQRLFTIGRHGSPWTPDAARTEAHRLLGLVVGGADPADAKHRTRKATTVTELCDLYFADAESGRLITRRGTSKKPDTILTDRGRIERHIKPLLGRQPVASITRDDIRAFMHHVAEGKTACRAKSPNKYGLANVRGGKATALWGCWGPYFPMRLTGECVRTTQCAAFCATRTINATAD
jgi:Arm DNA-binding domain